jgi:hypothetical protein
VVYRSSETSTNQSDVIIRAKKTSWDKTAIFLSVWRQKKKTNQRTKLSIHILDTIESESTTLPGIVHFISGVTHMKNDLLFCSKLMFTNGNIVVCKYII